MAAVFPVILLAAMVIALIDIIMRDEWQVRHLPKFGWILLVIFLPLVGSLLWFLLGREYGAASASEGIGSLMANRGQQNRPAPTPTPTPTPSTTEQQLAELDREIEYYQRKAELERLKREADGDSAR
ncbi:hypothetical protein ASE14_15065 [Agromyces sp. Root81]|uniref:PLD nuclease N-terminal domain-containing protein n=1 Tax=Agromyces sp. Root81 TaxID=1736601 RepID=UPI0006FB1516|nr:PLD nuclease N-terminal domain-containing protein [Agromyces sp. Root81]KRC59409.1 hypothetical protein ASE14_15065 [Agromyces sp. Root81]